MSDHDSSLDKKPLVKEAPLFISFGVYNWFREEGKILFDY